MPKITLFHGTAHEFNTFDERFVLRGNDPNSALGIHLTEDPTLAAEYARLSARDIHGTTPRVIMVEAEVRQVGIVSDPVDYLGRDPDFEDRENDVSRVQFIERRFELIDQGFDGLCMDENSREDLTGAWVVFEPNNLTVVKSMTLRETVAFAEQYEGSFNPEIEYEEVTLFENRLNADMKP